MGMMLYDEYDENGGDTMHELYLKPTTVVIHPTTKRNYVRRNGNVIDIKRTRKYIPTPHTGKNYAYEAVTPISTIRFSTKEMALGPNDKVMNFCKREGTPPARFAESIAYTSGNLHRRLDRVNKHTGQPVPLWVAFAIEWRTGGYIRAWEWLMTPHHMWWMRKKHAIFSRKFERDVLSIERLMHPIDTTVILAKKARALAALYNVSWDGAKEVSKRIALAKRTRSTILKQVTIGPNYEDNEEDED